MPIIHTKVSTIASTGDPSLVQPQDWNAAHTVSGALDLSGATSVIFGVLPNTALGFSATPAFNVTSNVSYSMLLTGNVTSSTTTGTPQNGGLLSLTLTQDAVGGRSFAFPANFVFTPTFTFVTTALAINELTFKFDGTNWHLVSNVGSGSSGPNPAGSQGDLQSKNGTNLQASSINDNGSLVTVGNDIAFKGPNPWIDVRDYGALFNGSASTTCTSTASSAVVTLGAAQTFVNGEGVTCIGAGTPLALSTPAAPTVVASDALFVIGSGRVVANSGGTTSANYSIRAISFDGQVTPASATTSINTQQATLGQINVLLSNWTRANNTVTITTSAAHTAVVNSYVCFSGDADLEGCWNVATVPDNTHVTITQGQDTRNGANTAMATGAAPYMYYWHCNHISWATVVNAYVYLVYRGATLIGVSYPDNAAVNTSALYNTFDDFGSTITTVPSLPAWYPTAPNATGQNGNLTTTIVSGAGSTTVTLAATAGSSNGAAPSKQFVHDDAGPIRAAAVFAQQHKYCIYIPVGDATTQTFTINSALKLNDTGPLCIVQAGSLVLNSPVLLAGGGALNWTGTSTPQGAPAISSQGLPQVSVNNAVPGVHITSSNGLVRFSNLNFSVASTNAGVGMVFDGGSIPSALFDHVQFNSSGATNYLARHQVFRSAISGFFWDYVAFPGGPGQGACPGSCNLYNPSPVLMFESAGGSGTTLTMNHVTMLSAGLAFTVTGGTNLAANYTYGNGPNMAMFNFFSPAGGGGLQVDINNLVDDTSNRPAVNYSGNYTGGYIAIRAVQGQTPGFPEVAGPGSVPVLNQGGGLSVGPNMGTYRGLVRAAGIDGITSSAAGSIGNISSVFQDAHFGVAPAFTEFVRNLPQTGVTCPASGSGSTISVGAHTIQVVPVFGPNNAEGTPSLTCYVTTTSGQNVVVTWPQVAGAVGYNVYADNNRIRSGYPGVNGTILTDTWTGTAFNSANSIPGGGPTSLSVGAVYSPSFVQPAANGGGVYTQSVGSLTANRTETKPDFSGTTVLSTGPMTNPIHLLTTRADGTINDFGVAPMPVYDSFNRANGTLVSGNSNWTQVVGAINVTGNQTFGNSGGAFAVAVYNGVSFPADDQTVRATLGTVTGAASNSAFGVRTRSSASADTGYACYYYAQVTALQLFKVVAGTYTQLGSNAAYTPVAGDVLSLNSTGTTHTCYINGVQKIQQTDATTTSGFPGLIFFAVNPNLGLDDWAASYGGVSLNVAQTFSPLQTFTTGISLAGSNTLSSVSGNSGKVGQTTGALTNTHFASFDANANIVDSGVVVGTVPTPLSSLTAATGADSITNGDNAQTWNWALTTAAKAAFTFTENTAAINGGSNQFLLKVATVAGSTAVPLVVVNSLTGSQVLPAISITPTWNTSGLVDAALLVNPTNTASATGSLLADFQLGAVSQWKVDKAGNSAQLGTVALGSSPPACTAGSGGGSCIGEGSAPSAGANYDTLYADSTQHAVSVNNNNTGNMPVSRVTCVNVTPVTVNTSTTSDQNLMSCTLNANLLNVVGRTVKVWTASIFSTGVASTPTVNTKIKLCTVSGCGSGTVVVLTSYTSAASLASTTNNSINTQTNSITQTAGASSVYEAHGNMVIDLGATPGIADSTFSDSNITTVGTIDSTASLFLQISGAFSSASASNTMTQRQLFVEVLN